MKKQCLLLALGMALLTLGACKKEEKKPAPRKVEPVRVETLTVKKNLVATGRVYAGVIEETSGTLVSFSMPGTINTFNFSEGQEINKGDLIGTIDDATLQSSLEISKAALATAQDTYDRMEMLHEANSIPEMKWVEVENALKAAQSQYDIALNALDDAKLYSPVSGVVSQKLSDVGQMAAPGVPVLKISQISPVKASISVPESEVENFSKGDMANVSVNITGGAMLEGVVTEKGVTADPLSRTYAIKFEVDNMGGKLLPGMLCNVTMRNGSERAAIVVPLNAVLLDSNNMTFVWLDANGTAHKQPVTLGAYLADGVIVEGGLKNGDKVIVAGQQKVSEGMEVVSINK